mmetsp:Transcript_2524/g.9534  ORF Transcript_2524/g.9534 Transcript_2524/m.9534 type:complete len:140 (-) Transcript_2524:359-778(-)|eukprot:CAMPEP_0117451450 /NCGR_PEP_ID=MMETSP0759-20121206/9011_1 /TAXON_ID=63605 /ORGANISM="Percolomonas cosmopolitus, Strain WS" /LENGTH=139 /DNA_ID=CAMNT_0005244045 /DNA_START=198 /DNA_END=617 /DNA_ORIENTATION=+
MASTYDRELTGLPTSSALRTHTSPSNTSNFFHYISYSSRSLPKTHTKFLQENGCGKYLYDVQRNGRDTDYADLANCFMMKQCESQYVNWQRHLRKAGGEGGVDQLYDLAKCWERSVGVGELVNYASFVKYLDDVKDAPF